MVSIGMAYELAAEGVQTVLADVLVHRDFPLVETAVRYAARRDFDRKDRWGDFLAIELTCPSPLRTVCRFNPNVRAETRSLTFDDAGELDLRDAAGQSLVSARDGEVMSCRMGPFELGFLEGIGAHRR